MILAGLLIPTILLMSYTRFGVGLIMVCGIFVLDTITMGDGGIRFVLNLYYTDMVLGLIALVAVLRMVCARDAPHKNPAWLWFCGFVCLSMSLGLVTFGSAAGVQARGYFYFMVASVYAMSFSLTEARLRQIFDAFTLTAVILVMIAIYRWIVFYTPIPSLLPPGGRYNIDGEIRVIYSNHALVLAQVLVGGLFFATASRGFFIARMISPALLTTVLVLQHRSVWLAGIVGVLIRLLLGNSKSGSAVGQVVLLICIAGSAAVPMVFDSKLAGVSEQVGSSASRALSSGGTGGERLESWGEIVKNWYRAGPRSIAIGQSFGTDNTRYVHDSQGVTRKISYIAHNLYVQTLFNTGLLGLIAYLAANWYVMAGLYRICRDGRGGVECEVLLVLIAMQIIYYIPYGVDYLQSFLFGAALAYVAEKKAAMAHVVQPSSATRQAL